MNHVAHIHSKENHLFAKGVSIKKGKDFEFNLVCKRRGIQGLG